MVKVIIKNLSCIETHGAQFESLELAQSWIDQCIATNAWGKAAYTEVIPATETEPAQVIEHPAEYTLEITDITAQMEQERINSESLAYLASTDWMVIRAQEIGVPVPPEVLSERQAARERIVK